MRHSCILDFFQVTESQTSEQIRDAIFEILYDYITAHRMLGFTVDGAPNVNKAVELLKLLLAVEREKMDVSLERTYFFTGKP